MADRIYSGSIDVTKITKSKLFKSENSDGLFLLVRIIVNEKEDQFGRNLYIFEEQTKEERIARQEGDKQKPMGRGKLIVKEGVFLDKKVSEKELDDLPF